MRRNFAASLHEKAQIQEAVYEAKRIIDADLKAL